MFQQHIQYEINMNNDNGRTTLTNRQDVNHSDYAAPDLLLRVGEDLPGYQAWIARLFAKEAATMGARDIIDFGAGTGYLAECFAKQAGVAPILVEIDDALRAQCADRGFAALKTIDEVEGEVDLIYSSNVLEHIEDDLDAVRKLTDKLRPGGRLALYLPAFELLWTTMDDRVGHFRRYTRRSLADLLGRANLRVEQCRYADSLGFAVTLLYSVLPARDGEPSSQSLRIYDNVIFPLSRRIDVLTDRFVGKNVYAVACKSI